MQKLETILILFFGSVMFVVVGGVLTAIFLWQHYAAQILTIAGIVFVVVLLSILSKSRFFEQAGGIIGKVLEDRRERKKTALELKAAHQTQKHELALHYAKLQDETRLRERELELQRLTTIADCQVKILAVERWRAEQAAGLLAYQTTDALYKPETGEVINLSREPREQLPHAALPLSPEDLPQAPPFREVIGLLQDGHIPLTWTLEGTRMGTLKDMLSMGLIGRPERGKTTALMYFTCLLLWMGAEVWVWDLHGELSALSGLRYFDRFDDIVQSVPYISQELDERDELYRSTKRVTGIGQVRKPLVLIADEVPVLAAREKDHLKGLSQSPMYMLRRFTLEARKWNGYVFLSGQSLPHTVLPTLTRDNLSSRIILECSPRHAWQMGLSKKAIDTLLPLLRGAQKGTHIADFSTWSEPQLADIPYTDADDLRWVLEQRQHNPQMNTYGNAGQHTVPPQQEQRATYPAGMTTAYCVIEERPQPYLLTPAFHKAGQKLQGDLLRVYQVCEQLGTTDCRRVGEAAGMGKTKANELINTLKRLGYIH